MQKKHEAKNPSVGPGITIFKFFVSILLNENRAEGNAKNKEVKQEEKFIGVMASRRRAMTELGRVTFSPDTTSGGGSPPVSLRGLPQREREIYLILMRLKGRKVRKIKTYIYNK